jgi:hypothetical protein
VSFSYTALAQGQLFGKIGWWYQVPSRWRGISMEVVAMLHGGMLHGGMLKASGMPAVNRDHEESKQALKQHLEVEHQVWACCLYR